MTNRETQAVLQTFTEKLSRLEQSSLKRFLSSKGWKMSWDFEANGPAEDAQMPEIEHLEAYVLNLRFFIQDREPTSLKNMSALYRAQCNKPELLEQFEEVRDAMNDALDREMWFRFNDQPMTYRMLFFGMIYTRFAHANKTDYVTLDQMTAHGFGREMAMHEFLKCVCVVHAALVIINKLNAAAF